MALHSQYPCPTSPLSQTRRYWDIPRLTYRRGNISSAQKPQISLLGFQGSLSFALFGQAIRTDDLRFWHVGKPVDYNSTYMVAFCLWVDDSLFSFNLFFKKQFVDPISFSFELQWAQPSQATHHSDWLLCHLLIASQYNNNYSGRLLLLAEKKRRRTADLLGSSVLRYVSHAISYVSLYDRPRITSSAA